LNLSKRISLTLLLVAALIAMGIFVLRYHCPASGIAFTEERREFHRLKNRTSLPQPLDFDARVTLPNMLQAGEDHSRWSHSRAAAVEGYVVSIAKARPELANCYAGCDTHILIALRPDAPSRQQMVLEVTPRMEEWARRQGWDWSEETLKRQLLGRWSRFEGWLLFDSQHAGASENIAPGTSENWRATAWEIHPVTRIEVIR
jgi:hypothetical protein